MAVAREFEPSKIGADCGRNARSAASAFGDSEPEPVVRAGSTDGIVERPETRRVINLASGVVWQRLTPHSDAIWVVIGRAADPRTQ